MHEAILQLAVFLYLGPKTHLKYVNSKLGNNSKKIASQNIGQK